MAEGDYFRAAQTATVDSTGRAEVTVAPPGEGWVVTLTSVTVSSNVKEPTFKLYLNGESPANFLEGSYSGSQDSSTTEHRIDPGASLVGVWTGADVGAKATLRVSGSKAT